MTKVLVVDDEPEVRAAVEDGLTIEGYEVRGAADGLAVLDVMMPVLDGLGVCRRLRVMEDRTPIRGRRRGCSPSSAVRAYCWPEPWATGSRVRARPR